MGVSLEEARTELARIISTDNVGEEDSSADVVLQLDSFAHKSSFLSLCFCHRRLASEQFSRHERQLTVLEFLFEERVDVTTLQTFCDTLPGVLSLKNPATGNLPLHSACSMTNPTPGLIPYLVQKNPKAACTPNKAGDLPIHLFLKAKNIGTCGSFRDSLKSLVSANRKSITMPCRDGITTPLHMAMEACEQKPDVVDYLCSQLPNQSIPFFHLSDVGSSTIGTIQLATALSKMLPQLRVLHCKQSHWDLDGWNSLLASLQTNCSIRELTIVLPSSICPVYLTALDRMLSGNDSIERLILINRCTTENHDFTNIISSLLRNNIIQSFTMVEMQFDLHALSDALTHNTSLSEWNLEGCPLMRQHDNFANILEERNRTLTKVILPSKVCTTTIHTIAYWTALNRYGRRHIQNPNVTIEQVCCLLGTVREIHYLMQQSTRIERHQLQYGLLRESPSVWSSS